MDRRGGARLSPAVPRDLLDEPLQEALDTRARVQRPKADSGPRLESGRWRAVPMRNCLRSALTVSLGLTLAAIPAGGQTRAYRASRTADGKPNLNGIWQALNEAYWDIEAHAAAPSPVLELGAAHAAAGGLGIVEAPIPYKPDALAKKHDNYANRLKLDPEIKCYLP